MPEYYSENRRLNDVEMHVNADYFYQLFTDGAWTVNAIAGLFGNAQSESRLNPGAWQDYSTANADADDKGFGFVQWTPARDYRSWCSARGLDPGGSTAVFNRFLWEAENGLQYYPTNRYPQPKTFFDFMRSSLDPRYLAEAFLYNYERPQTPNPKVRGDQAEYWFTYLSGIKIRKKTKWIYYTKRRWIL